MKIEIVKKKLAAAQLQNLAKESFGDMVKAVVDIKRGILALGGELHADAETILLRRGSKPENIWGINIYPDKPLKQRIEFIALINIRPSLGQRAMEITDPVIKEKIQEVVNKFLP